MKTTARILSALICLCMLAAPLLDGRMRPPARGAEGNTAEPFTQVETRPPETTLSEDDLPQESSSKYNPPEEEMTEVLAAREPEETPSAYADRKGNAITDGDQYRATPEEQVREDPQYRPAVPSAKGPTTKAPTSKAPATKVAMTKPVTTTKPSTTKAATIQPPSTKPFTTALTTVVPGTTAEISPEGTSYSETSTGATAASTTKAPITTTTTKAPTPANGWYQDGALRYYYVNGKAQTGYQSIGGKKYFFGPGGVLSSKVGIDVSKWNGAVDWKKVKASGVDFVMIRVGYRGYGTGGNIVLDEYFKQNILGATDAGLDCGVYFYTQAISIKEAREEAEFVLKAIQGFRLTYPIAFDIEHVPEASARTNTSGLTKKLRTDFCIEFCNTVKNAGYFPTIYANKYWLETALDTTRLGGFDTWLAHYANQTTYKGSFQMWQYTETGTTNGVSGYVDLNIGLKDYAVFIRQNGYNKLK